MNRQTDPELHDTPIGIRATGMRREADSMGEIEVPADRYWGAQTQRSLVHFSIGDDRMPKSVYHAYGYVKKAAALVNAAAQWLPQWKADAIVRAADEAIAGKLDDHFPLYVWQTGSGTQSNMNVNEVFSNRAIQLLGGEIGSKTAGAPERRCQHGAVVERHVPHRDAHRGIMESEQHLLPHAEALAAAIETKANEWMDVVKTGRTHLHGCGAADGGAGVVGVGAADSRRACPHSRGGGRPVRIGGGWNGGWHRAECAAGFRPRHRRQDRRAHRLPFVTAPNKFAAQGSLDAMVACHGGAARAGGGADEDRQRHALARLRPALRAWRTAVAGKRAGLLDHARQGQSDPVEAMVMVCIQVIGEDNAVAFAGSQGNFELNAMRPIIINNFLHSARILGDACEKLRQFSVEGTRLNRKRIDEMVAAR